MNHNDSQADKNELERNGQNCQRYCPFNDKPHWSYLSLPHKSSTNLDNYLEIIYRDYSEDSCHNIYLLYLTGATKTGKGISFRPSELHCRTEICHCIRYSSWLCARLKMQSRMKVKIWIRKQLVLLNCTKGTVIACYLGVAELLIS